MSNLGYIQVTRKCNQRCLFCSNPENEKQKTLGAFKKMIDELCLNNYSGVIFTGGEPTTYKNLKSLIIYANKKNIIPRIISNGQVFADINEIIKLQRIGLNNYHISFYSYKKSLQNYLTENNESYQNVIRCLDNFKKLKISINVNIVINKFNSDHLDKNVFFLTKRYPDIYHFVFNNLDPYMNRASENKHTIPKLIDFKDSFKKALNYLNRKKISFRVERVPLCYLGEYSWASTETRKIVKDEERTIYFLDDNDKVVQDNWKQNIFSSNSFYKKNDLCEKCRLTSICAGLYSGGCFYSFEELKPVINGCDLNTIKNKILGHG